MPFAFSSDSEDSTMVEIIRNAEAEEAGNQNLSVGFEADGFETKRAALTAAGFDPTPVISPAPGVEFFYVKDPAGVNVQFIKASYL